MEELKIKRKKLVESLKLELADKSFDEFESSLKWLLKGLFEEIPRSGRTGYDSENMKPFKERISKKDLDNGLFDELPDRLKGGVLNK